MSQPTRAYIGIGSNVGDRVGFVRRGAATLQDEPGIVLEAVSSLYETSPVGGPPQRSFVNAVARVSTTLEPHPLLEACKEIERRLGRDADELRWGPRVIDLDILLYGSEKVIEPDLEIPHPRLTERRFALVPLLELDPEAEDPWGTRYADALEEAEGDVIPIEPFSN